MIDFKQNFSANMLLRLVVLSLIICVGILANIDFFKDLYHDTRSMCCERCKLYVLLVEETVS